VRQCLKKIPVKTPEAEQERDKEAEAQSRRETKGQRNRVGRRQGDREAERQGTGKQGPKQADIILESYISQSCTGEGI
jgi:hypothetical protein